MDKMTLSSICVACWCDSMQFLAGYSQISLYPSKAVGAGGLVTLLAVRVRRVETAEPRLEVYGIVQFAEFMIEPLGKPREASDEVLVVVGSGTVSV